MTDMNKEIHRGIAPAILTPFDASLDVDHLRLGRSIERLLGGGVNGIVANGTLAEAQSLSFEERRAVTRTVVDAVAGAVPVTVGVSESATWQVTLLAEAAVEDGADALMCLPPLGYRASTGELTDFFSTLADATPLPVMIYNNPATSKNDITPATIIELSVHPHIHSVKECSGDARRIAHIVNGATEGFEVLVGGDDWAFEGLCAGAAGWISGVANVAPEACVGLRRLVAAADLKTARDLNRALLPLARLDMTDKLVQYFKGALERCGHYAGPTRPPRGPLNEQERHLLDAAVAALEPVRTATTEARA